uniref:Jerky n=1 Tax=Rhipicephalus zambeziensis TaxID=60191 RepID=A0A224YRW7_9ACAR
MTIEELLSPLGYDWSWQQIRCHWKNLKSRYNHERRNLRPGQKSSWKYYNVMDSLLKQQTRAGDLASGRGDDSENSSGAENSADAGSYAPSSQAIQGPSQHGNDEYIVPTVQESSTGSTGTAIMQHLGASASAELSNTVGTDTVLVKKEVETDEEAHCEELHVETINGSCEGIDPQRTASTVHAIPSVDRSLNPASEHTTELQQIEQILSEPDISPAMNSQDSACAESQSSSIARSTDVRTRTSRRYFFTTGTPGLAEKKTRLELDILAATKRKLLAEQMKAEAEQRKAVAETLLLTEALKKYEEEKKKAMAETMFLVQERIRSEEETRRAAAMAAFHIEEKRKAAAEAEMLNEHKKYFMEQRKTEVIKRRMLLLELQKMRRDLKLVP